MKQCDHSSDRHGNSNSIGTITTQDGAPTGSEAEKHCSYLRRSPMIKLIHNTAISAFYVQSATHGILCCHSHNNPEQ